MFAGSSGRRLTTNSPKSFPALSPFRSRRDPDAHRTPGPRHPLRGSPGPCRGRRPPRRGPAAARPRRSRSAPAGGCPPCGAAWRRLPPPPPPLRRPPTVPNGRPTAAPPGTNGRRTRRTSWEPRGFGRARAAAPQRTPGLPAPSACARASLSASGLQPSPRFCPK